MLLRCLWVCCQDICTTGELLSVVQGAVCCVGFQSSLIHPCMPSFTLPTRVVRASLAPKPLCKSSQVKSRIHWRSSHCRARHTASC